MFLDGANKKAARMQRKTKEKSLTEAHRSQALTFWACYHSLGFEMVLSHPLRSSAHSTAHIILMHNLGDGSRVWKAL